MQSLWAFRFYPLRGKRLTRPIFLQTRRQPVNLTPNLPGFEVNLDIGKIKYQRKSRNRASENRLAVYARHSQVDRKEKN
jgi:hypothetical protein